MSAVSFCPTAALGCFSTAVFVLHRAASPLQLGLVAFLSVLSVADGLDLPPVPLYTLMFPAPSLGQLVGSAVAAVPHNV